MPYIKQDRRAEISRLIGGDLHINAEEVTTAGELNYAVTKLVVTYMRNGHKSYQEINDIIGALEGAKMEFYRRVAAPYEDGKIETNGDVY